MPSRKELLALPGVGPSFLRSCERARLVPEPIRDPTRPGRPYVYPDEAIEILGALAARRKSFGRIDAVGFATWWDGYDVPMTGIRIILGSAIREAVTMLHRGEEDHEGLEGLAVEVAYQATMPPAVSRASRSRGATYWRSHGDEIEPRLVSALAVLTGAESVDEMPDGWSADFSQAAELDKLSTAGESAAVEFLNWMVRAGLTSLDRWEDLPEELTDRQLRSSRDCVRKVAESRGDLKAVDRFLGAAGQWRVRALAVVLWAALDHTPA